MDAHAVRCLFVRELSVWAAEKYQIDIIRQMHIISLKMLRTFWDLHPEAETVLRAWHTVLEQSELDNFAGLKAAFRSADYAAPYTIFDVGGNNYRVITVVRYRASKVFIRWVMTHRQYDQWNKLYRKDEV